MAKKQQLNVEKAPEDKEPSTTVIVGLAIIVIGIIITAFVLLSRGPSPEERQQEIKQYALPQITVPQTPAHTTEQTGIQNESTGILPSRTALPDEWTDGFILTTDKDLQLNVTGFVSGRAKIYSRKNAYGGMTTTTLRGMDAATFATAAQAQSYFSSEQTRRKGKSFSNDRLKTCFVTFTESKSSVRGFFVCLMDKTALELFVITPKIGDQTTPQQMLELLVKTATSAVQNMRS